MHILRMIGIAISAMGSLTSGALAEGDAMAGKDFAVEWCTRCHNVEPGGPAKQHPPSFASIAAFRSEDQIRSRIIIPPLHSSMPELGYFLTPESIDDVVSYIVSLENSSPN